MRASGEMRTAEPLASALLCRVGHLICILPPVHVIETTRLLPVAGVRALPDSIDDPANSIGLQHLATRSFTPPTGAPGTWNGRA